jgi:hypothetical protein
LIPGTGVITKSELKYFYTAFMDVGKLGEQRLDEITNNAYRAMTSVKTTSWLLAAVETYKTFYGRS